MDWKRQFKFHGLNAWNTCIVFLLIAFNLLILILFTPSQPDSEVACCANCASRQNWIYRTLSKVPDGEGFEIPPEWTVADLIRDAAGKDFQTHHPQQGESVAEMGRRLKRNYLCRNVHCERKFFDPRGKRREIVQPYLVFPVPASAVFDQSLPQPVPILMCPPGAHGKYGSLVLYSDGSTKKMTAEEAEKLVAEQSPVSLEIDFKALTEKE